MEPTHDLGDEPTLLLLHGPGTVTLQQLTAGLPVDVGPAVEAAVERASILVSTCTQAASSRRSWSRSSRA